MARERLNQDLTTLPSHPSSLQHPKNPVSLEQILMNPIVNINNNQPETVSKKDATSFEEALKAFTIVSEQRFFYKDNSQVKDCAVFTLASNKEVVFVPPTEKLQLEEPHTTNSQLVTELDNRQIRKRPRQIIERIHEKNLLFFMANWPRLSPYFYHESPRTHTDLKRFSEVTLNDFAINTGGGRHPTMLNCGIIDFLGIGPDGQMVIIEFSPKGIGKRMQLARHARGLETLMGETRTPPTKIHQLKGFYTPNGKIVRLGFESQKPFPMRGMHSQTIFQAAGD